MKFLTDDINTISIVSPEKDAVLKLREVISHLDMSEAVALATTLSHSYSINLGKWVGISASCDFSQDLTTAVLQVSALSRSTKLAIAIEILQAQIEIEIEDEKER